MAFRFSCPQGHVLEGDPATAGQHCQCPQCGVLFVIPHPGGAAGLPPSPEPDVLGGGGGAFDPYGGPRQETLLHIPCPNGHHLETPRDLLGQDVMCPHCGVQFHLREQDSVEYKRKIEREQERKDAKAGKFWFNMAIVAVVLVVLGVGGLILYESLREPADPATRRPPAKSE